MGIKYKFRLSEITSSGSWLHNKLSLLKRPKPNKSPSPRITAKPGTVTTVPTIHDSIPRKSYHFSRDLNPEQVKSPQKTIGSRKEPVDAKFRGRVGSCSLSSSASSTSNTTSCSSPPRRRSRRPSAEFRFDRMLTPDPVDKTTSSSSSSSSSASRFLSDPDLVAGDVTVDTVNLAPIVTNNTKNKKKMVGNAGADQKIGTRKRFSSSALNNSPGMRLRTHSPRLLAAARRMQARKGAIVRPRRSDRGTNGKCRGFAVVKSSFDPWKDFRESMVEMIVENEMKDSKDLEELLVCYLSLNSEEYHEVIVAVFAQIWCDLTDICSNEKLVLM